MIDIETAEARAAKITASERPTILAERLSVEKGNLARCAGIIREGGIVAFPFNGVFGLFGDIDNLHAVEAIIAAKKRPKEKKLVAVSTPENVEAYSDLSRINYSRESLIALWKDIHALGIILPASTHAPYHLTVGEDMMDRTILTIWTEYSPLRTMIEHCYSMGSRGLVGTSANKFGEATHFDPDSLWEDFKTDVKAVVVERFEELPLHRRKSTSIIDLTNDHPRLYREGNVSEDEIRQALERHNFPELVVGRDVITVRGRAEISSSKR